MKLRITNYELRVTDIGSFSEHLLFTIRLIILTCFILGTCYPAHVTAAKWSGVDESVVEKYAEEHGRAPRVSLINTDQGDLLLFLFLLGGAVAGFAAGYYWRQLTEKKADKGHGPNSEEIRKGI